MGGRGGGGGEGGKSSLLWPLLASELRSVPGSKFRNENFALMNHKRTSKKKIPQHSQIDVTNYGSGCCPQRVASVVLVKGVFVLVQGVSGLRFWVFVLVTPPLGTQKNLSPRSDSNPRPSVLYRSIFSNLAKALSTRIRFYLKTDIFLRFGLPSTRIWWKQSPKTHLFKNALRSEDFLIRRLFVYVWMDENENVFEYHDVIHH